MGGGWGVLAPPIRAAPTRPCKRISPLLRSLEGNNKKKKVITEWRGDTPPFPAPKQLITSSREMIEAPTHPKQLSAGAWGCAPIECPHSPPPRPAALVSLLGGLLGLWAVAADVAVRGQVAPGLRNGR